MPVYKLLLTENTLNEAITNDLYHYTGIDAMLNIIKNNRILLSSSLGTESDNYGHKPFFLSTARTPSLDAGYPNSGNRTYRLVLDKNKLEQKFKTKPVDYWQRKDPNNPQLQTLQPADRAHRMNRDFEFEERIYSDKPYIENALNYIKGIEGYVLPDDLKNDKTKSYLIALRNAAKEKNIPIGIYQNKADLFKKQNSIADTLQSDEPYIQNERPDYYSNHLEPMFALLFYNEEYLSDYDKFKNDFDDFKVKNNLPDVNTYKTYDLLTRLYYSDDGLQGLISDLHNTFKQGKNNNLRKNIHYLVDSMKKNNVNSVYELYKTLVRGLNTGKQKQDYTNKVQLAYKSDYEDEPNQPIPSSTPIEKLYGMYFNTYKYGGQLSDTDGQKYFDLRQNNGTIGDFINYLYNTYTPKKADSIIQSAIKDDGRIIFKGISK